MKAYDQYLKTAVAVFCALCLPADALACEAENVDFSTLEYVYAPALGLEIKKGNDELVDRLRLAADQDTVEISDPLWDELSTDLGLRKIEAHLVNKRDSEGRYTIEAWFFFLTFPPEIDPDYIAERYRSLPYVLYISTYGSWENTSRGMMEESISISAGMIMISIKEGYDDLVDQLRSASAHYTTEIRDPAWNDLSAELGLIYIGAFSERLRRFFVLSFPLKSDLNELVNRYCSLPYIEHVELNWAIFIPSEIPSATTEATWGLVKHRGLDFMR